MEDNITVELTMTCSACPEQYDATINGETVAYLRLRHGRFTVQCPDAGGEYVFMSHPNGDGCFEYDEREEHINAGLEKIVEWYLEKGRD